MPTREPPSPSPVAPLDGVRERPGGRSARIRALVLDATREELLAGGYGALSHRAVAQRAGVDPATVYRRWPTRPRLATDALLEVAQTAVPVPDTGAVERDLVMLLDAIVAALADPQMLRLFHALSAASAEAEGDLIETLRVFWEARFAGAEAIIVRGIERGELTGDAEPHVVIEQLVAPAYFRALVTGEPLDAGFTKLCVRHVLAAVGR
ncbi:MAG: TetR/AcrR family transcriptional regulator [Solirubrobacteraceae bacterium]